MTDRLRRERYLPDDYQFGDATGELSQSVDAFERAYDSAAYRIGAVIRVPLPRRWRVDGTALVSEPNE